MTSSPASSRMHRLDIPSSPRDAAVEAHAAVSGVPSGHTHSSKETCQECGHVGREARILITGTPTNPSVHFDAADETSLAPQLYRQHVILAGIVRRQVFVDELGRAEAEFEVTEADRAFRHVLIRKGDAVLGYVRWRASLNLATGRPVAAVLDMLCTLARYRGQGCAKRLIGYCIKDIAMRMPDPAEFTGLIAHVPLLPAFVAVLFQKFGFQLVPDTSPLPTGVVRPVEEKASVLMVCPVEVMGKVCQALCAS